jgi:hypothetical protein
MGLRSGRSSLEEAQDMKVICSGIWCVLDPSCLLVGLRGGGGRDGEHDPPESGADAAWQGISESLTDAAVEGSDPDWPGSPHLGRPGLAY